MSQERLPPIRAARPPRTRTTLRLADGVAVKVVPERLGPAGATITLTVYQHVHARHGPPGADRFAALLGGLIRVAVYHAGITRPSAAPTAKHPGFTTCRNTVG
jgi:hypothetical protein